MKLMKVQRMYIKTKPFIAMLGVLFTFSIVLVLVMPSRKELYEPVSLPQEPTQRLAFSPQLPVETVVRGSVPSSVHAHTPGAFSDSEKELQTEESKKQHIGGDYLDTNEHDTPERLKVSEAISYFQTKPRYEDDYRVAKKLLPLLKEGMTRKEIHDILGEPSRVHGGGRHWYYGLFYSQFIEVRFNEVDRVDMVTSTLSNGVIQKAPSKTSIE